MQEAVRRAGRHQAVGPLALFALYAVEFAVIWFLLNPANSGFDHFAFCDQGANLTVQALIAKGLHPAVDFAYPYGLIPLLVGKLWFGLFGRTASAYQGLMLVCGVLIAWGLARIAGALAFGGFGIALLAIMLGFIVQSSYPSLSQATEQVLLTFALGEHARGRRAAALAWTAAAVFAKPSMAYVYGFCLTLLIGGELVRERRSIAAWIASFAPAAITAVGVGAILASIYGWPSLVRTAFPLEGMSNYRAMDFGFLHGSGRAFWDLKGLPWIAYLISTPGFWIASTVVLIVGAVFCALAWYRTAPTESRRARLYEIVITCAILHVVFVTLLFGNRWSWFYYAYLLVIGVAAIADLSSLTRRIAFVLCILGAFSWTARAHYVYEQWVTTAPDPATGGLWATQSERSEWSHVLALAQGHRPVMLDINGAVEQMFPQFEPPTTLYLLPGLMSNAEIARKIAQLQQAELVVVPSGIEFEVCRGVPDSARIHSALDEFEPEWKGRYFTVYRRIAIYHP